jgi:hypothetical protein
LFKEDLTHVESTATRKGLIEVELPKISISGGDAPLIKP